MDINSNNIENGSSSNNDGISICDKCKTSFDSYFDTTSQTLAIYCKKCINIYSFAPQSNTICSEDTNISEGIKVNITKRKYSTKDESNSKKVKVLSGFNSMEPENTSTFIPSLREETKLPPKEVNGSILQVGFKPNNTSTQREELNIKGTILLTGTEPTYISNIQPNEDNNSDSSVTKKRKTTRKTNNTNNKNGSKNGKNTDKNKATKLTQSSNILSLIPSLSKEIKVNNSKLQIGTEQQNAQTLSNSIQQVPYIQMQYVPHVPQVQQLQFPFTQVIPVQYTNPLNIPNPFNPPVNSFNPFNPPVNSFNPFNPPVNSVNLVNSDRTLNINNNQHLQAKRTSNTQPNTCATQSSQTAQSTQTNQFPILTQLLLNSKCNKDNNNDKDNKKKDKNTNANTNIRKHSPEVNTQLLDAIKIIYKQANDRNINKDNIFGMRENSDNCNNCDNCDNCDNSDNNNSDNSDNSMNSEEMALIASYPFKWVGENIKNINDLINLGKQYDKNEKFRYSLDMNKIVKLVDPLIELQKMIGLTDVKNRIFEMIMYYIQNLDRKNYDMLHTIITGPPGVGKTQLITILAKIYNRLGFLKTDKVIFAKREDFVGSYVGQTAIKTKKLLESAIGGVLVLDEAYSLGDQGNGENKTRDTFAIEAINTITPFLSEHKSNFAMIIAGYKDEIEKKFLSINAGLDRRFEDINRYNIEGYNSTELQQIFKTTVESNEWYLDVSDEHFAELFKENMQYFNYFGGDMFTLYTLCKKVHSKRINMISEEAVLIAAKKHITDFDLKTAINMFVEKSKLRKANIKENMCEHIGLYN